MDFIVVSLLVATFVLVVRQLRKPRLPLPPGPKGLPIVGNLFDLGSSQAPHIQAVEWSKQYDSDVVSVSALGHTSVFLNSHKAVEDLFLARGSNYSDRPDMPMLVDLVGWDWTFAMMRYGPRWKEHRRIFHTQFDATISEHRRVQVPAAHELLQLLQKTPNKFLDHFEHFTARIIMQRVYGYIVTDAMSDPLVLVNKAASESTSQATVPGTFLVDTFPILKHVPAWMPGAGFKRVAAQWRKLQEAVVNRPFDMVKDQLAKGTAHNPSFVGMCLEDRLNNSPSALSEDVIKSLAAVVYAAGSDTNLASITSFILAMVIHQDVQKKIQAELDSVLGGERLPEFSDKEHLPYLWNVLREVMRWLVVFPFAIPHRAMAADTYNGYYIPKDATVLGNSWALLHDPEVYPDPETFNPDRYNSKNVPDPIDYAVFGFGRRSCSGKNMALDTVWIAMATVLAVYDIKKPIDANGKEVTPKVEFRRSTINHPAPFECSFKPRSAAALALIQQAVEV
ncbi:hypothetical protein VKT23_013331 [Stygiomarasmius scandens]|uniref:Cytochrome P450 n=1 Tax=Marasmiellus scandens TaxID=2682957 RepID=A0ABR1J3Q3_9AGAR